jgi:hypothetical protein
MTLEAPGKVHPIEKLLSMHHGASEITASYPTKFPQKAEDQKLIVNR